MKAVVEQVQVSRSVELKMEEFGEIIEGVSYSYLNNKWVDREDLEQELWVNLLNLIEQYGGVLELSGNLVATSSFNKAASYYRYCRRRYESNQIFEEEDDQNTKGEFSKAFKTPYEVALMKSVYEMYPVNSRKRKYIIIRLVMEGELDPIYIDHPEDRKILLDLPEKCIDSHITWKLGYKSSSPGSFTKLKNELKEEVAEFLEHRLSE